MHFMCHSHQNLPVLL